MKRIISLFLFLFVCHSLLGNNFRFESKLPSVDSTGFYKIQLPPALNARLNHDFSDLRLYDKDKKEVPYILKDDVPVNYSSAFIDYEIVDKKFLKDSATQVVIKNESGRSINNISLVVRNADVRKELKLTGSFDRKQWFVVKESELITSISSEKDVAEIKLIDFPLSNYTYYRIELNDKHSAPVDIIKAGYYESSASNGLYTLLPSTFTAGDSTKEKTTWVHIILEDTMIIDEIEFKVSGPEYFLRNAELYSSLNKSKHAYNGRLAQFELNSKLPLRFNIGGARTKDLWLKVFNEDNQPLKFAEVNCYQLNHYSIAKLEKEKQYTLRFGDSLLSAPNYDIRYFQSVIPADLKVILPGEITLHVNDQPKTEQGGIGSIFSDKRFLWVILSFVILLLGVVTFRMMKNMNQ